MVRIGDNSRNTSVQKMQGKQGWNSTFSRWMKSKAKMFPKLWRWFLQTLNLEDKNGQIKSSSSSLMECVSMEGTWRKSPLYSQQEKSCKFVGDFNAWTMRWRRRKMLRQMKCFLNLKRVMTNRASLVVDSDGRKKKLTLWLRPSANTEETGPRFSHSSLQEIREWFARWHNVLLSSLKRSQTFQVLTFSQYSKTKHQLLEEIGLKKINWP